MIVFVNGLPSKSTNMIFGFLYQRKYSIPSMATASNGYIRDDRLTLELTWLMVAGRELVGAVGSLIFRSSGKPGMSGKGTVI